MAPKILFLFEKDNDRYWLSDATGLPIADGCPLLDLTDKELVYETELLMMVTSAMEAKLMPLNYNYLASYKIAETYYVLLEERLDGGRFPAISPSSNSATLEDGDPVGSDDETPTTRYPPTYSLSDSEDKDCAASEIVAPSQITTNPSTSSDGGILTPSQSTATTRAFSPVDVNKSDDPKRDEFTIGDSDGRSKDKKPVSSTGSSYKNPEVATNYDSDTNSEPINNDHSRRHPISTDEVPPRQGPSQAATNLISQIGRSGLTWGAMSPDGYHIQFDINKAPIPKFVQVSPDTENPSRSDAQSRSNRFTPSTTRKPLPHPLATDGLSIPRDKPYWTEFGLHWPPRDGPLYLPPLDPNDPYKAPDRPI
ncbi:hypothetical protein BO83DRAFT_96616 [Aspergillus eucalypticola CBS 122712]|uniref:Uncharacterized protein n=1 Tax=Aspergillus eucalypticola (strain CBS 122712 / IBT 29274) TaxID=1448314 RepID=A0A317V1M2_ASPEC|nr:uncharacterized protein BO83DRAFT_96616 [Aspergillus eucalypticola CBS 122712]PWY67291.1 hypothetical protein BO83DRAFT_96616 [Aspergillus eucalypticola CBS 122712]